METYHYEMHIPRFQEDLPNAISPGMTVPVPDMLQEVAIRGYAVQVDLVERHRVTSSVDADLEELFLLGQWRSD